MPLSRNLLNRLGMTCPIIQAPMAGGTNTVDLAVAVAEAGAFPFFGSAYQTPKQIAETAAAFRARSGRPFGFNLFCALPSPGPFDPTEALECLAPFHTRLGIASPTPPMPPVEPFDGQMQAVLETDAVAFSFTFGIPPKRALAAAKANGMVTIGTATTVEEAVSVEQAGCDAVTAQGSEAGAHRGTFAAPFEAAMIGAMALVPQVVDSVSIPVIAAGGIMDGRGIAAALALGACAAQMGTAFLVTDESGTAAAHKKAIIDAREHETRVTRAFSGRYARGIANEFMNAAERAGSLGGPSAILPYPAQNALTRPMRTAAAKAGDKECLSLWAGQGVRLARRMGAGALVAALVRETEDAIKGLSRKN